MILTPKVAPAVVDLSRRTKLRCTGADRVRFLNGQVSNDVRHIDRQTSIYTCVMTIKGKMCADAFIHTTDDALWLDAEPEVRESLLARLEKYIIADDVVLEDVSADIGLWHLLPGEGTPTEGEPLPGFLSGKAGLWCVRSWRYGQPGWDLFGSLALLQGATALFTEGREMIASLALETRRILAGVPKWGAELDADTMPAEAGLEERAVSYHKGCYIGQEVVSRVKSVGHVNRLLRGLRAEGPGVLTVGSTLHPAGSEPGARAVGRVTSVAPVPGKAGASIALAFVRRGWETVGGALAARPMSSGLPGAGDSVPAGSGQPSGDCQVTVCGLPFIS